MSRVIDPEGAHLAALHRRADFRGQRVLEMGCGDGRLTIPVAREAVGVLAFDPDADAVERARRALPARLEKRVTYQVASGRNSKSSRVRSTLPCSPGRFDEWSPGTSCTSSTTWSTQCSPAGESSTCRWSGQTRASRGGGQFVCEVDGDPLFRSADAATAAIKRMIRSGRLIEEAVDDHDVRTHFPNGAELVADFEPKDRSLPEAAIPKLLALTQPVVIRERCRLRRLAVR